MVRGVKLLSLIIIILLMGCVAVHATSPIDIVQLKCENNVGAGLLSSFDVILKNTASTSLNNLMVVMEMDGKKGTSSYFSLGPGEIDYVRIVMESPEKDGTYPAVLKVITKQGDVLASRIFYISVNPVMINLKTPFSVEAGATAEVSGRVFVGSTPASGYVRLVVDGEYSKMSILENGRFEMMVKFEEAGLHTLTIKYGKNEVRKNIYVSKAQTEHTEETRESLNIPVSVVVSTKNVQLIEGEGNMVKLYIMNNNREGVFEVRAVPSSNNLEVNVPAPFIMKDNEEKAVAIFINGWEVGKTSVKVQVFKNGDEIWSDEILVEVIGKSAVKSATGLPFMPGIYETGFMLLLLLIVMMAMLSVQRRGLIMREPVKKEMERIVDAISWKRTKPLRLREVEKHVKQDIYPVRAEQIIY